MIPLSAKRICLVLLTCWGLDYGEALAQVEAAQTGSPAKLLAEARAYEHGEGVVRDIAYAITLYCEGARQGDAEALFSLGWIYANGRGVARDDTLAAYFFGLAAKEGHEYAARMLSHVGDPVRIVPECMRKREADPTAGPNPDGLSANPLSALIAKLAPEYGVQPELALAIVRAESNFNPNAVSPKQAQGLMQLIPETAARFNVAKPFDPEQNLRGGLAYLRWLLAYFKGQVALVAAAYNAGEGAVNRFRGIPPFAETQSYVKQIMASFRKAEHPYDSSVTPPSPELPRIRTRQRASDQRLGGLPPSPSQQASLSVRGRRRS